MKIIWIVLCLMFGMCCAHVEEKPEPKPEAVHCNFKVEVACKPEGTPCVKQTTSTCESFYADENLCDLTALGEDAYEKCMDFLRTKIIKPTGGRKQDGLPPKNEL